MLRRSLLLVLCLFISLPAFSLWKTLKTEAFTVFYPSGREQEAKEVLEVLEYYRGYAGDLVGSPLRRVAVVLEDIGMQSNGLTSPVFHRILLFRSPPSEGELGYHQNWWRLVGVHEYTHWRHLSAARGFPGFLTMLFGNTMVPGDYTPGWLKEGICVVAESGTSPYEGRLNEGLFDAYATILAQRGSLPSIVQATYNMDVFPGSTGLRLFGGQFVEFLIGKFGRERVSDFFVHYSASILSYLSPALPAAGLDRSARKVFGESIRSLWLEWQLELMRRGVSFKRPEGALTDHGWWLRSPVYENGDLYYQRSFAVKASPFSKTWQYQLMHLEAKSGRTRVLLRSSAPFSGPMRVRSGKLYYAVQELEGGYDNHTYNRLGYTSVLYSRDLIDGQGSRRGGDRLAAGGRSRRLFTEPFRTFEVLADGTILTAVDRQDAFGSVLRLHDQGGTSEPLLVTDLLVSDIVADARNLFVAARADWENTRIYRITIPGWSGSGESLAGVNPAEVHLEPLHDTPFQEAELCLAEGRLFYSATYGARRTLYEYEIDTAAVYRGVASDFARSPAWDADSGTLYYIGLDTEGEDLYREKALRRTFTVPGEEPTAGAEPGVPSPGELEIPDAAIRRGGYFDNLASLRPRTLVPVFTLDPYTLTYEAGAGIAGTSALGDISYSLLGYYDSYDARPELDANLRTNILAPLTVNFDFTAAGNPSALEPDDLLSLALTLNLPLYQSLRKGLSYFSLGSAGSMQWEFDGDKIRTLFPFTMLGFRGAASSTSLQVGVQAYHEVVDAELAYLFVPILSSSLVFLGTELSLQAIFLYDLQGLHTWSIPRAPPGYPEALEGSWGGSVFSTLSIPLLRLRAGLWNPGLYFGDLFLVPFASLAFNQDRELQMSYGGTVHLELKAGARDEGFPLDLYAGLGMTREGQPLLLLGAEIVGYGGAYLRGKSSGAAALPVPRQ
jgi:hypothetical protein